MTKPPVRVLIVDDHADFVESECRLLGVAGYQCETAHDVVSAVEKAEQFQPQIVLFDLGMPGDGFQLPALLRGVCNPLPRLIAISGYADRPTKERLVGLGVFLHFAKPVEPSVLLNELAKVVAGLEP